MSPKVPQEVKHRTAWAAMYPHIQRLAALHLKVISATEAANIYGMGVKPKFTHKLWMTYSTLYCLGYCFTIARNIAGQLTTRANAAAQSIRATAPGLVEFVNAIQSSQYEAGKQDGCNNWVLGWVVAVNQDREYDPKVKFEDLLPADVLASKFSWDTWSYALFDQLKLVSLQLHATSVRFGAAGTTVYDEIEDYVREAMRVTLRLWRDWRSASRAARTRDWLTISHQRPELLTSVVD